MPQKMIDYQVSLEESNTLKGIAICLMILHHLFFLQPQYGVCVYQLAQLGKVCVSIFLFLSGYGLAVQYGKRISLAETKKQSVVVSLKFVVKRLIKFYLNYWVVFLFFVPLGVFAFGRSLKIAYGTEANLAVLLLKDFWGLLDVESYNATWWFNFLIISLYLLFPFLFLAMKRKIVAVAFLVLLVLWPRVFEVECFFYLFELWNSNLMVFTLVFCLGIGFAHHGIWMNKVLNILDARIVAVLAALCCLALSLVRQIIAEEFVDQILLDAVITSSLVLLVVGLCRLTNKRLRVFSFLGKYSTNMYLTHTFIIGYFFSSFVFSFKYPIAIFAVSLLLSLGLSVAIEFAKSRLGFYKLQQKLIKLMD